MRYPSILAISAPGFAELTKQASATLTLRRWTALIAHNQEEDESQAYDR